MYNDSRQINAFLALGSNLGDRLSNLTQAIRHMEACPDIRIQKTSPVYETEPWPREEIKNGRPLEKIRQNWHLNQVIQIQTTLSVRGLLEMIQSIEKAVGKESKKEWGSRVIDIDILLYGDESVDSTDLKIPHPYMTQRQFVLIPLLEIAPKLINPQTGQFFKTYLDEIGEGYKVIPVDPL